MYLPHRRHKWEVLICNAAAPAKMGQAKTANERLIIAIAAGRECVIGTPLHHAMRIAGPRKNVTAREAAQGEILRLRPRPDKRIDISHRRKIVRRPLAQHPWRTLLLLL